MNNKFLSGFLAGLAGGVTLIIFGIAVIFTVRAATFPSTDKDNKKSAAIGTEVSKEEIDNKVSVLEKYIDKYYLDYQNKGDQVNYADGIYKGLLSSLDDRYSTYYTAKEYSALEESSNGVYCGIGASVSQDQDTGIISIVKPFKGGPAYNAGILPGDILYKVSGEEVTGEDLTQVVSKMKGKEGTTVKIEIMRKGKSESIKYTITRNKIEIPTIEYQMLDGKIGYIAISEFDEITAKQFRQAVDDLEAKGEKGLVVDLRDNGGGRLDAVVDMLDRMLPKGMIVYTKDKYGKGEEYKSTDKEQFNKPLAVLINGNTASASEIFSGAIQDYKLGTLVGTTSFGKGIVQSVIPLGDGSAIKLTTSKYYTPKGRNIQGTGIKPDVEEKLSKKLEGKLVITKAEDNQLQKAIEIVKGKMK
jgi:C-terminal peptidase (prc)